jgi:hypothetical protein
MKFIVREAALPHRKITGGSGAVQGGMVACIVRVSIPNHVPAGVAVRERIDPFLFTADIDGASLNGVADDPAVIAISPAQRVDPAGR